MDAHAHSSAIPAEALARQTRLSAVLRAMEEGLPSREPASLQELRAMLLDGGSRDATSWIKAVTAADLVEEAAEILRASRRHAADMAALQALAARMAPLALKAQQRRSAIWHLDTRRTLIRFCYVKEGCALGFDDGDLRAIFLHAFRLEGLVLALDLGKRPRLLLSTGLPLPADVGGRAESMDAVLRREPVEEPATLMARLNRRLPEGLGIHHWDSLPSFASPVGDLAQSSHWRWVVPDDLRARVEDRIAEFTTSQAWPWDRGGAKAETPVDLRHVVTTMGWEAGALCFSTRMGGFQALNPLKALGAILGLDPSRITGLLRAGVDLKPDPRLGQAERFEPKLKNMYEDAVPLGGGSNIVLVDEDDDEPIRLG